MNESPDDPGESGRASETKEQPVIQKRERQKVDEPLDLRVCFDPKY